MAIAPKLHALPQSNAAEGQLQRARRAQAAWGQSKVRARLKIIRHLRCLIAKRSEALVAAVGDRHGRTPAETLATEVIPLAASWSARRRASWDHDAWVAVAGRYCLRVRRRKSAGSLWA